MNRIFAGMAALIGLAIVIYSCVFTVAETKVALKTRLGQIVRADYQPGLHFQIPFLDTIHRYDRRVLSFDILSDQVLTVEKKNVSVESFVKWKIFDTEKYYTQTGGDRTRAEGLLIPIVRETLFNAFGKRTVQEVVAGDREAIMSEVRDTTSPHAQKLGVALVDVRIKKVEWPEDVLGSVYERMVKERKTVANRFRSEGEEQKLGIMASADRERAEIIAKAEAEAEAIRGKADAESARIYADAYGADPEFFGFQARLKSWQNAFGSNDLMAIDPSWDIFNYLQNPAERTE